MSRPAVDQSRACRVTPTFERPKRMQNRHSGVSESPVDETVPALEHWWPLTNAADGLPYVGLKRTNVQISTTMSWKSHGRSPRNC